MFYLGKEGRVKFDKPGTYDYTVYISGVKAHAHTGTVVVKSGRVGKGPLGVVRRARHH